MMDAPDMRVLLACIFALCLSAAAGFSQSAGQARDMAAAFDSMRSGEWSEAANKASKAGVVASDVIEWHRLRKGVGTMAEYQSFLDRRADWPGLPLLQRKGEKTIPRSANSNAVLKYFATAAPQTGVGALRQAAALKAQGHPNDSKAQIVKAWRAFSLSTDEHNAFVERHGAVLKSHHEVRLDMLLWRGLSKQAKAMMPLVNDGWDTLAKARIGLRQTAPGVDVLIEAVPSAYSKDPGLAFERFQWRARKGRNESAIELMLAQSSSVQALGEPQRWASWRRSLARRKMREGQVRTAYRLASTHFLTEGSGYADLEWLAGYLALRYLDDPAAALAHFQRFRGAVFTPISLGRAGYWEGRAHAAMGNQEAAEIAYAYGAEFQTSFYGQLAAEAAGLPMDPRLTGGEAFPPWQSAGFTSSSVFQAALLLHGAGEKALARRFMVHLAETQTRTELGQLADLALELDQPNYALMIAKQAARMGYMLHEAYFPMHELAQSNLPVAPELALSIARRESEFDPRAQSPVGARGLMQLMPRTAQDVAGKLGLSYSKSRLTSDPVYNARLGSAYLAELIEEFGNNPILVTAAYNAGPSRSRSWLAARGDPRKTSTNVVDWIEHIPFRETRNYVMRVSESLPVYRARLSGKTSKPQLMDELGGS